MWLGGDLLARVDREALERAAAVETRTRSTRIALRSGTSRNDLERVLEPILPGPA